MLLIWRSCRFLMAFEAALTRLPAHLLDVLAAEGALEPAVFVMLAGTHAAAVDLLDGISKEMKVDVSGFAEDLTALAALAQAPARCARKLVENATGLDIALADVAKVCPSGRALPAVAVLDRNRGKRKGLGAAPKWPAKIRRKELRTGAATARHVAEQEERGKWCKEVAKIITGAGLPAAVLLCGGPDDDLLLGCVGQGRRVRTIKKRVADWRRIRAFMLAAFGAPWPKSQLDFLEYLRARADEPCAKTVPSSSLAALVFMEKSGNVAPDDRISNESSVKAYVEEMNLMLSGQSRSVRRAAPRWPVAVAIALELAVLDRVRPVYERLFSWWMLVKLWGTLRFDDHRGLDPARLRLERDSLHGELIRTKTSGTNKSVQVLPLYVDRRAWLVGEAWLQEGFSLWVLHGFERDFSSLSQTRTNQASSRLRLSMRMPRLCHVPCCARCSGFTWRARVRSSSRASWFLLS